MPSGMGLSGVIFHPPLALFSHSGQLFPLMAEQLDPKEVTALEKLALFNI